MKLEITKSQVAESKFAVGYNTEKVHANMNNGTELSSSIYQKVNKNLEVAVNLGWTAGNSSAHFGIAVKHQLIPEVSFWPRGTTLP